MTPLLKQSTSVTLLIGPFLDDSDGNTVEDSLTVSQADVRLSKNGGNMAQKNDAAACAHDELGYYTCDLDATDTGTLGILKVMVHESGALPVWHEYMVVPANTYDSLVSGSDYLDSETAAMAAGVVTAAAVATDAIDADAVADDAIDAGAIATGAIDADAIAAAAITAAKFAAGAIDANATAADFLAEINAEVADVLGTDTIAEMAQGLPPITPTAFEALMYLYMTWRNNIEVNWSTGEKTVANNAGTVIAKKENVGDDGTSYSETKMVTGP